jgi:hypothetical protein
MSPARGSHTRACRRRRSRSRGDDRLQREAVQLADPPQRVVNLLRLDLELALVAQHLPGRTGVIGKRRDLVEPRLEQRRHAGLGVGALALVHARAHQIPREAAVDEHDVAARGARDAGAAEGERVDAQRQLIADRRARRSRRLAHRSSHSSSAFCAWRRFSA